MHRHTPGAPRVLCVDDERNALDALRRQLEGEFAVQTAPGAMAGLDAIRSGDGFAVVISDLRMPEMDGVAFLKQVRRLAPDTSRVLLTGHADLASALAAVNEGSVFRFLTKPSSRDALRGAVAAGVEQHRLVTAERLLLEQTLHGSIQALTDVLALIHPAGFGRAMRAKALVRELVCGLGVESRWEVEVAAMLSQVGVVALAPELVERLYRGEPLTYFERLAVDRLPAITVDLVSAIPRMEGVAHILACQPLRFDGQGGAGDSPRGTDLPWGARVLKLVLDYDDLVSRGISCEEAIATLHSREGSYDPELLASFVALQAADRDREPVVEIGLRALEEGMVFAEDVRTPSGVLLIARGQEASTRLIERVRNLAHSSPAKATVRVTRPGAGTRPISPALRARPSIQVSTPDAR